MSPGVSWSNFLIKYDQPIVSFDVLKDEELREAFIWKSTQALVKIDNIQKVEKN